MPILSTVSGVLAFNAVAVCQALGGFIHDHSEALVLFGIAMAVTMPERLPWPFGLIEPLEWFWEWLRKGLVTFVSLRGPVHGESSTKTDSKITQNSQGTIEAVKSTETHEVSAQAAEPAKEK